MKVLFLNNYNMEDGFKTWKDGEYPGHHIWGVTHLPDFGVTVDILPFEKFQVINNYWRVQKLLGLHQLTMRGLDQQIRVLFKRKYDLIYSGCHNHTFFLARLRALGLFKTPIVAIVHHPVTEDELKQYYLEKHDLLICLSDKVRDSLILEHKLPEKKVVKLDWGVDLQFFGKHVPMSSSPSASHVPTIVSAGKSNRDFDVLVAAANNLNCQVNIYCSENTRPTTSPLPENVYLESGPKNTNAISYTRLADIYKDAYAIAIPLNKADVLKGLTSLLDAVAVGRPIIMTWSPYIDIDIEALGIGIWVKEGDSDGWRRAISKLIENPRLAADMGNTARLLGEQKYNVTHFTNSLANILKSI